MRWGPPDPPLTGDPTAAHFRIRTTTGDALMWVDPTIPADLELIGLHWEDGAVLSVEHLTSLLTVAQEQVEPYAPALALDAPVPERYRVATIFQARDLRDAQLRTGSSEIIGVGDYAIRARPLTALVKGIVRPPRPPRHFGRRASTGAPA